MECVQHLRNLAKLVAVSYVAGNPELCVPHRLCTQHCVNSCNTTAAHAAMLVCSEACSADMVCVLDICCYDRDAFFGQVPEGVLRAVEQYVTPINLIYTKYTEGVWAEDFRLLHSLEANHACIFDIYDRNVSSEILTSTTLLMRNFVYLYLHFYTKKSLQFYTKKSLHILHIHTHFNQTQAHAYKQIKAIESKHIVEMYRKIHCTRQSNIYELLQATCISWLLEAMIGICADRDTKLVNLP